MNIEYDMTIENGCVCILFARGFGNLSYILCLYCFPTLYIILHKLFYPHPPPTAQSPSKNCGPFSCSYYPFETIPKMVAGLILNRANKFVQISSKYCLAHYCMIYVSLIALNTLWVNKLTLLATNMFLHRSSSK
jgi:hypothetical protein